ncbi:MAG: DUF2975 domain-containing protein [Clostridiales bacterium]|nr:DUF2975 domain-containing protein [Clostridiales bacterium]
MLRISKKYSVILSLLLAAAFFIVLAVLAAAMPALIELFIQTPDGIINRSEITAGDRIFMLILSYLILASAMTADILMFILLLRVRAGLVFTPRSVALIRGVSWCCILFGVLFAVLCLYFQLALAIAFAALFLGLCIRIVKNVLEEATEIKSENDLTV